MAKKKTTLKAAKVLNLLNTTTLKATEIAEKVGCTAAYVWQLKKEMAHKMEDALVGGIELTEDVRDTLYNITLGRQRRKANATQEGGDHYKRMGVEPWDVFDTWPLDQRIGAYRANCTKYIMRLDEKDTPLLNAKKLSHYAQKLVEVLEQAHP